MANINKPRVPREPGRSGRAFQKRDTRPITETGWTVNIGGGIPWVPVEERLVKAERPAKLGDAAAVVDALAHCHLYKTPIPDWVMEALSQWLTEFVALATPTARRPKLSRMLYTPWAREYLAACKDWVIADHLESSRRVYGLTWPEAFDEASCHFRTTPLQAEPRTLKRAWQRARRRARLGWFQRMPTTWESRVVFPYLDPPVINGGARSYWYVINADRQGNSKGEWRERPRLLAHLSAARFERDANARGCGRTGSADAPGYAAQPCAPAKLGLEVKNEPSKEHHQRSPRDL